MKLLMSSVSPAAILALTVLFSWNVLQAKEFRVSVTDTQGRVVEGRLVDFSAESLRLAPDPGTSGSPGEADGETLVSRTDLLSLRNLTAPPRPKDTPGPHNRDTRSQTPSSPSPESEAPVFSLENFPERVVLVTLGDGTRFVASDYTADSRTATITLPANLGNISLPIHAVAHVRFQVETASLGLEYVKTGQAAPDQARKEEDWTRLLRTPAPEDRLAVFRAEALDSFPGIVLGIDGKVVRFETDGEVLPIPRAKVAGILYHQGPRSARTPEIAVLHDRTGSRILLADFSLDLEKATLSWVSAAGIPSGVLPLDFLARLELPQWNLVPLFSLKPSLLEQSPFFIWSDTPTEPGSPKDLFQRLTIPRFSSGDSAETVRDERRDLGMGGEVGMPSIDTLARLDGRSCEDALVLRARTLLCYDLNGSYTRLRGRVGVDDRLRPAGRVRLRILGDETVLFDEILRGDDKARPLDLSLEGLRRLSITADFPEGFAGAAQAVLADVILTKP